MRCRAPGLAVAPRVQTAAAMCAACPAWRAGGGDGDGPAWAGRHAGGQCADVRAPVVLMIMGLHAGADGERITCPRGRHPDTRTREGRRGRVRWGLADILGLTQCRLLEARDGDGPWAARARRWLRATRVLWVGTPWPVRLRLWLTRAEARADGAAWRLPGCGCAYAPKVWWLRAVRWVRGVWWVVREEIT